MDSDRAGELGANGIRSVHGWPGRRTARFLFGALSVLLVGTAGAGNTPPVIKHEPVSVAPRGQTIAVRATVSDDVKVKAANLFVSTSRDAAPFKLPMQDVGAGSFLGSIPGSMLQSVAQVSYYIEALDDVDAASETAWYVVELKGSGGTVAVTDGGGSGAGNGAKRPWWKRPAVIVSGVAAGVGAGLLLSSAGGGGSSSGSGTTTNVGTFAGSVTTCLEWEGTPPECQSHAVSFTVVSSGIISSDTLYEGQHLESRLTGSDFAMTASVNETNATGTIQYRGSVLDTRVTGVIQGDATGRGGRRGVFFGTFSASKP